MADWLSHILCNLTVMKLILKKIVSCMNPFHSHVAGKRSLRLNDTSLEMYSSCVPLVGHFDPQ